MATNIVYANGIEELTATVGTADFVLAGPVAGQKPFSSFAANGSLVGYFAHGYGTGSIPYTEWETGVGTWTTGNVLVRSQIDASSNAGAKVIFSSGTKTVSIRAPDASTTVTGYYVNVPVNSSAASIGGPTTPSMPPYALVGDASAQVYFRHSENTTSYTVTSTPGSLTATGTSSPINITGLTNTTAYTFTVKATNNYGTSAASVSSNTVTPSTRPASIISGLIAWYDASQLSAVANTTPVSSWTDFSGNGNTGTQSSSGNQPTYRTSTNWGNNTTGKPAIRFDGTDDFILTPLTSAQMGPEVTMLLVFSLTSLTNNIGLRDMRIISNEVTRSDLGFAIATSDSNGGGGNSAISVRVAGNDMEIGPTLAINTPYIASIVPGGQIFLNGTRQTGVSGAGAGIGSIIPNRNPFYLGKGTPTDSMTYRGDIAEVLFFKGRLSDSQRQAIEAYLGTKYGITVASQPSV